MGQLRDRMEQDLILRKLSPATRRNYLLKDQAELAKLAGVTRARMKQVMALLGLTPDIHKQLLLLEEAGMAERELRKLLTITNWESQRRARGKYWV